MQMYPLPSKTVESAGSLRGARRVLTRTITLTLEYDINKQREVIKAYQWEWWDPTRGVAPWKIVVGDLGKWIEATAYSLATDPDPGLDARMGEGIDENMKG